MTTTEPGAARSPGISYQELLDADTHPVPDVLRLESPRDAGGADFPKERYTSRAWHEAEKERLWSRVWQFACRRGRAFGLVPGGPSICWHACDFSRVHGRNEVVVVVVAAGVVCPASGRGVKEAGVARWSWRPSLTCLEAEIAAVSAAISTFGVERKSEVEARNARAGSLEGGSRVVFFRP